jgi:hypothetical protein
MPRKRGPGALWVLVLMCITMSARADIRTGFGTEAESFYPLDTFYSDSRFQFIIPQEELRVSAGETLNGIRMHLNSSTGYSPNVVIRMKNASQGDLDSMALGRFVNGGLTTIRTGAGTIPSTPGWVVFNTGPFHPGLGQ